VGVASFKDPYIQVTVGATIIEKIRKKKLPPLKLSMSKSKKDFPSDYSRTIFALGHSLN